MKTETPFGQLYAGDCREILPKLEPSSVDCVITGPPYYGLRNYGDRPEQIGQEPTTEQFFEALRMVAREIDRVLVPTGSFWMNMGDGYYGGPSLRQPKDAKAVVREMVTSNTCPCGESFEGPPTQRFCSARCGGVSARRTGFERPKSLLAIPFRLVDKLVEDGWILRQAVIWYKPNHMPTHVKDRMPCSYEYLFWFVKYGRWVGPNRSTYDGSYYYEPEALADFGDVWVIPTEPSKDGHPAPFPPELVRRPLLATCPPGGVVLDPFFGSGTVGQVAEANGRRWIGIEANPGFRKTFLSNQSQRDLFRLAMSLD